VDQKKKHVPLGACNNKRADGHIWAMTQIVFVIETRAEVERGKVGVTIRTEVLARKFASIFIPHEECPSSASNLA